VVMWLLVDHLLPESQMKKEEGVVRMDRMKDHQGMLSI